MKFITLKELQLDLRRKGLDRSLSTLRRWCINQTITGAWQVGRGWNVPPDACDKLLKQSFTGGIRGRI